MDPERWERIAVLFEEGMQVPRTERQKFVEERCDGDTGLAREVLRLLSQSRNGEVRIREAPSAK